MSAPEKSEEHDLAARLVSCAAILEGAGLVAWTRLLRDSAERIRELEAKNLRAVRTLEHPLDQWLDRSLVENGIRSVRMHRSRGRTEVILTEGEFSSTRVLGRGVGEKFEEASAVALNDAMTR